MKWIWLAGRFYLFFGTLLLSFYSLPLLAEDFSADVIETLGGKVETYRIHVQHNRYVMERSDDGKQLRVIVDRETERTRIVVPEEKTYYEIASDDLISLINDPFMAAINAADKYATRPIGKERLQGFDCNKILVHSQGHNVMTLWMSEQSVVPLKLAHASKTTRMVELKDLKIGAVDAALFQIPGDFKKKPHPMQKKRAPDPTTLSAVTGSVSGEAPWGRRVKATGEMRIKVNKTRKARVRVINLLKNEAKIEVLPFHQGKQRENIGVTPQKLEFKGSSFNREFNKDRDMFGDTFEVDKLVIKVSSGLVHVVVDQPGKEVRDLYNRGGVTTWERLSPDRATRLAMTGDNPDGDTTSGEILVRNDQAKTHEKLPFEVKNGETKVWNFGADKGYDNLQITVPSGQGSIRILLDQTGTKAAPTAAAAATMKTDSKPTAQTATKQAQPSAVAATAAATSSDKVEPARMVLVLDASGSMWGQIDGKAKIAIAKEVVTDLIDQLPAAFQTGLAVYGHRRKGDCDDIEMMIPVGPHNAAAMKQKVQRISPKGKTPLSEAVRQAAEALRYTEERASVVLVSDGLETCKVDPCALAAELAMSGVDFTVHVIGFDIGKEEQSRLRCLADKTGGLFLTAANAKTLRDALFQTVQEVKAPPPPVVEDPGKAMLKGPASVPVGAPFKVAWEGPDSRRDFIAIARKGSREHSYIDYTYTEKGNPVALVAPGKEGRHELRYVHAHTHKVIGRSDMQVTAVTAEVHPPASVVAAAEFEVPWKGPDYSADYLTIARPDDAATLYDNWVYTSKGSPARLQAPAEAGAFEVRYILERGGNILARALITVDEVSALVQPPKSANSAEQFQVAWKGPNNQSDYICVSRPSDPPGLYDNWAYTNKGSPVTLQAPADAGSYEVRYIQAKGTKLLAKAPITIKAVGAQVQPPTTVNAAGKFQVTWSGPDNPGDYICVSHTGDPPGLYDNWTYTKKGSPATLIAPSEPGDYEVRYIQSKGTKQLAKAPITVNAVNAEVIPPASAKAGEAFQVAWQGPDYQGDYLTLALPGDSPGRYDNYVYTSRGSPARLMAPAEPGEYEVRYILARGTKILARKTLKVTR